MEEHFISYSCIFISYIQCFEVSFQKSGYFSKKQFFQNFDWSNLIFDQSKSCLKNSVSLCLVRLIEPVFRSIEHRESSFLKIVFWLIQTTFSKLFQSFLSLSNLARLHRRFFVVFNLTFAWFFSHKAGNTFIPLLLFLFSCFHAFKGHFRTSLNLGFLVDSMLFFWNWSLGFVGIFLYTWSLLVNLINLGFCEKLEILGFMLNLIWGFCLIGLKLMKLAC